MVCLCRWCLWTIILMMCTLSLGTDVSENNVTKEISIIMSVGKESLLYFKSALRIFQSNSDIVKWLKQGWKVEILIAPFGVDQDRIALLKDHIQSLQEGIDVKVLEYQMHEWLALNQAMKFVKHDVVLFTSQIVEIASFDDIVMAFNGLKEDIGVVGGKIMTHERTIHAYGIDVILTNSVYKYDYLYNTDKVTSTMPLLRYQGYHENDPRAQIIDVVDGVSKEFLMTHKTTFNRFDGFSSMYNFDVDYCFKVASVDLKVIVVPSKHIRLNEDPIRDEESFAIDVMKLSDMWSQEVLKKQDSTYIDKDIILVWHERCHSETIDYIAELMAILKATWRHIPTLVETKEFGNCVNIFKTLGYPLYDIKLFENLYKREIPNNSQAKRIYLNHHTILDEQVQLDSYDSLIIRDLMNIVYEKQNKHRPNVVWAPSQKVKQYYVQELGFNETQVRVLPYVLDTHHFSPRSHIPYPLEGVRSFNILMDIDELKPQEMTSILTSYLQTFRNHTDVTLFIRTFPNRWNLDGIHEIIRTTIADMKPKDSLPPIFIFDSKISYMKLPSFYSLFNVYIHACNRYQASLMQVLSMGIPVLSFSWSLDIQMPQIVNLLEIKDVVSRLKVYYYNLPTLKMHSSIREAFLSTCNLTKVIQTFTSLLDHWKDLAQKLDFKSTYTKDMSRTPDLVVPGVTLYKMKEG